MAIRALLLILTVLATAPKASSGQSTDRQTQTDLFCQQQINRRSVTKANTLRTLRRRFRLTCTA